jgi:hypothetical protein
MVINSSIFLTCTIATLRLIGLTLFLIKWIRHNMCSHERVQSCVDVSNFDVQSFLFVVGLWLSLWLLYNSYDKTEVLFCSCLVLFSVVFHINFMSCEVSRRQVLLYARSWKVTCLCVCRRCHGCSILSIFLFLFDFTLTWIWLMGTVVMFSLSSVVTRQAMFVWCNIKACSRDHCCCGKAVSATYFCVCGCRGAGLCLRACSLAYPTCNAHAPYCLISVAATYFSTLSHKRHDFWKKKLLNMKCVLIFSTAFIWNISHSKKNSARYCHKWENVFM